MSTVNGLKCGSEEQRYRWCSQADCSWLGPSQWCEGQGSLPKGLGKHLRGSGGGHLGHAILRDLSAPPFCAAWPTVAKSIVAPQP